MIPPRCPVCNESADRCDPTQQIHRSCFQRWSERGIYTRRQFEDLVALGSVLITGDVNGTLHCTDALVVAMGMTLLRRRPRIPTDDAGFSELVYLRIRHVAALDTVWLNPSNWSAWVRRESPTWEGSAHVDDLALFAQELPALRAAWPDGDAILRSPNFMAYVALQRRQFEP